MNQITRRLDKLEQAAKPQQPGPRTWREFIEWDQAGHLAAQLEAINAGDLSALEGQPEAWQRSMIALAAAVQTEATR